MTYGWAILVIAVVLGVLFQLGVFGSANLAPKAKAGQCQVQIVGSGSSTTHQLAGLCSPELPQYVAQFGGNSYIYIPSHVTPGGVTTAFSVFAWVYVPVAPNGDSHGGVVEQECSGTCTWFVELVSNGAGSVSPCYYYDGSNYNWCSYSTPLDFPLDTWEFVGFVVTSSNIYAYADNQEVTVGASYATNSLAVFPTWIGTRGDGICGTCITGDIADVQAYNASLTQAEVDALYMEGIGGAPVRPQNLTGWWPLNGNTNDYSGNNNNGQNNGASYSSFWTSGYSAP